VRKLRTDFHQSFLSNKCFCNRGYINHSLFWENLAKAGTTSPSPDSALVAAINKKWGSVSVFIEAFNTNLATLQGSGWGWLVKNDYGELEIILTANQEPVLAPLVPIIGVDAWEHGYYLQVR
jgi:Fe-Mn family superoxide dismutase